MNPDGPDGPGNDRTADGPGNDRTPPTVADLARYHRDEASSFHMPGHKQRGGHHPLAADTIGATALRNDVSEMGGFDYLHSPTGSIDEAQKRSAQIFGAQKTWFLVNGSTVGNLAAIIAHAGDGDTVAMLRGSHRSVYSAVGLCGADPHYLPMHHDTDADGWFVAEVPTSLPGRTRVLHITRPNYYGVAVDLAPYRELADRHGAVLVVDEAHGSHFGADPRLPSSALQAGADIVIQSTHKSLSSLTQSSMLHVGRNDRGLVNEAALAQTLAMLQSSSPSALLTVSLDLAAHEHARDGFAATKRVVDLAMTTRDRLARALTRSSLVTVGDLPFDPTKLIIDVAALGMTGFAARAWLRSEQKVNVELADHRRIVCSLTVGDTIDTAELLIGALAALDATGGGPNTAVRSGRLPDPTIVIAPRTALQARAVMLARAEAEGATSADYLIPYPPGIPLVAPGELLSGEVLAALGAFANARATIVGATDPTLAELRVIAS